MGKRDRERQEEIDRQAQAQAQVMMQADMSLTSTVIFLACGNALKEILLDTAEFSDEEKVNDIARKMIARAVEIYGEIDEQGLAYFDKVNEAVKDAA